MNFRYLGLGLLLSFLCFNTHAQKAMSFNFGTKAATGEGVAIAEGIAFTEELGYGFESEGEIHIEKDACTSESVFYFSVNVPEGVYKVELVLGSDKHKSLTTLKAESRRLMFHNESVKRGGELKKTILVDVRSTYIDEEHSIRIKKREVNYLNWDKRLSLEFLGDQPSVRSISVTPYKPSTTIFLAGNSTVTDQDCSPWASWGQMITASFDTSLVVANYAVSGASLASFRGDRRLDKLISRMLPGDYLFIEFGHNDQKQKGEGIGPWDSFTDLLVEFISKAREKGGIPVLVTPTQRRSFGPEKTIILTHGDYPDAMRQVAKDLKVPLIDVHQMTKVLYESWGVEESKNAFVHYPANTFKGQDKALKDNTHFNEFGANEVARCVLQGIIDLDLPIAQSMIDENYHYTSTSPHKIAEWDVPMSPREVSLKPDGN